jgi:glycosyltransferase involved in cell wall biosynthesis/tetratricopeptide (TPR) repeat protein
MRASKRNELDICIVSGEFMGPVQGGGIATFYTTLAESLAEAGHRLTLLYTRGNVSENEPIQHWVDLYRASGIRFVPLPEPSDLPQLVGAAPSSRFVSATRTSVSYRTYLWLRQHDFDVVHVPEIRGCAFYALGAKHQGIAFRNTLFVVGTRGGSSWLKLGAREFLQLPDDLELDFMERQSVALADIVLSPNEFMLRWLENRGWRIPEHRVIRQNILRKEVRALGSRRSDGLDSADSLRAHPVREIVFFGKLAELKGLTLFCDALDRLVSRGDTSGLQVTFLGRDDRVDGRSGSEYVRDRAARWPFRWQVVSDRNQSGVMDYLIRPNVLAVVPSLLDNAPNTVLECLGGGVPLIASHVGGIPELIHEEDRHRVLFPLQPERLAEKMADAMRAGMRPARPAFGPEENERSWIAWHEELGAIAAREPLRADESSSLTPLVNVCVSCGSSSKANRRDALQSIWSQDYPSYQVTLVDWLAASEEKLGFYECPNPESKIKRVRLERGTTPGAARNRATKDATGEYLLFVEDTDRLRPEALSTLVRVAERTKADVVTSLVDYSSSHADSGTEGVEAVEARRLLLGAAGTLGLFRNVFGGTACLVRSRAFESLGGYVEKSLGRTEEYSWEFYARAVLKGLALELVPEALFFVCSEVAEARGSEAGAVGDPPASLPAYLDAVPKAQRALLASISARHRSVEELKDTVERLQQKKPDARNAMVNTARVLLALGQSETASSVMSTARRLAEASGSDGAYFESLLAAGQASAELGRARNMQDAFERAEEVARRRDDAELLVRSLLERARSEARLGKADDAAERLAEALRIASQAGANGSLVNCLLLASETLDLLGRTAEAGTLTGQALALSQSANDHDGTARALVSMGKAAAATKEPNSVSSLLTALKSAKQAGDVRLLASTLLDVGAALVVADQPVLAKEVLGSCLQVSKQVGAEGVFLRARDRLSTLP